MTKIYLAFMITLFTQATAQTLTQSFNEPVVGEVDKHYRLDTSAYTSPLPIAITGSNCVWDFSKLIGNFPLVVDSFITASAALGGSAYPTASYVQHRDLLYTFYKSTTSPQQTELMGAYSPSLSLNFTNTAIIASYPVSYGYHLTDPVGGTFKYNTTNGVCIGSITISADGLGTANFGGTVAPIPNVLCLKSVEVLTLSIGIAQFGTFNQTIYNYYMPGRKYPILNINYTSYGFIAGTPTTTAFIYGSNDYFTGVGINESSLDKQSYRAFPNPFHDQLFITSSDPVEENEYIFHDTNGRILFSTYTLKTDKLESLSPGLYFLQIKNKTGTSFQKLMKE